MRLSERERAQLQRKAQREEKSRYSNTDARVSSLLACFQSICSTFTRLHAYYGTKGRVLGSGY